MKKVVLVTCTESKTSEEFEKRPIFKSIEKLTNLYSLKEFDFKICKDNKTGLSEVYNSYINNADYSKDILLFMHDDIEIKDLFLVETLNLSPYTVTGLAGIKTADLNLPPAWHLMGNREQYVGEVAHKKDDTVWTTVFGPTKSRTLLVDGLFIAVDVEKILNSQARFNEKFKFHHYDLSFCLECNKHKIPVGVMPIPVIHHGLGDSMHSEEWNNSAIEFKKEYYNS
jgi:hypothetical protein